MRILYIDIDSLRPDHLGCYGYHRKTSPNIDLIARDAVRFTNVFVSDAPCLPSRTALWSGRFGFQTGVVGHGGTASQPFIEGPPRRFRDIFGMTAWMPTLRRLGYHTATVSSFAERHSAWHWLAGYNELHSSVKCGQELADEVSALALDWLRKNAESDNWFLHVNFWDPHTPYSTPLSYGNPFSADPLPAWLTEEVRQKCWDSFGPHSAQEPHGYGYETSYADHPRMPASLDSMEAVRMWIDGYDTGIKYMDDYLGHIFSFLADAKLLDDTVIVIGADHAENLGELNVWGDHQTADAITCRVPLIIRWPGLTKGPTTDTKLHYHFDWAATLIELLGGMVPENWNGQSFAPALKSGRPQGRDSLIISQQAWACQRSVLFDDYIYLRTWHDGHKCLEPEMLFNLSDDPHEQNDLFSSNPEPAKKGAGLLEEWTDEMMRISPAGIDPMATVLSEGGPFHCLGELKGYVERLKATNRPQHARRLEKNHPGEL